MIKVNNNLRHTSCPLCKSNLITFSGPIVCDNPTYFSTVIIELENQPELWSCSTCVSSFVQNSVCEKDAIDLYTKGSSSERWTVLDFEKSKTTEIVNFFESILKPNMKVLDIGCGSGNFLDFAMNKGCITHGVEYSQTSLQEIKKKGHIAFSGLDQISQSYDLITAFDLIEHLYDAPKYLQTCKDKLSSNGCLAILTGDISSLSSMISQSSWWYTGYPEHIVFPSKKYFINYSGLKLSGWTKAYHAPEAKSNPAISLIKLLIKLLVRGKYNGVPSIGADHRLILLKK